MNAAKEKYEVALSEIEKDCPDIPKVLELLNDSMNAGSAEATYALATWYLFGHHVEKNWRRAAFLLKKAVKEKHPLALYDLAVCYETGRGVKKDKKEAFRLYLQAALRGDEQSVEEIARCYHYGIGIVKDTALADIWYERAEELGVE